MKKSQSNPLVKGSKIVTRALLVTLALGGILVTGAIAPNLFSAIGGVLRQRNVSWVHDRNKRTKKILSSFSYLLKKGYIKTEYRGKQLYIFLTPKGKKKIKKYNIDLLRIRRLPQWDRFWRMVLFDVDEKRKVIREALRGKLKELGFYQLQKSVWVHAFPCEEELRILQEFFGLDDSRFMCFEVTGLPHWYEEAVRRHFKLS